MGHVGNARRGEAHGVQAGHGVDGCALPGAPSRGTALVLVDHFADEASRGRIDRLSFGASPSRLRVFILILSGLASIRLRRRIAIEPRGGQPQVRNELRLQAITPVGSRASDVAAVTSTAAVPTILGLRIGLHARLRTREVTSRRGAKVRPGRTYAFQVVGGAPRPAGPTPLGQVQEAELLTGTSIAVPTSTPSGADADHSFPPFIVQCITIRRVKVGASTSAVAQPGLAFPLPGVPARA